MGSVMDYMECPNCGDDKVAVDYYYKTGDEYALCNKCGYNHQVVNRVESVSNNPFGAYMIMGNNNSAQLGSLDSEEDYQEFVNNIFNIINTEDNHNLKKVRVNRYVDGKHTTEYLLGKEIMKGDTVYLNSDSLTRYGYIDTYYTITDIVENREYPVSITCDEWGGNTVGFIKQEDILKE